jgi:hypothetical protein
MSTGARRDAAIAAGAAAPNSLMGLHLELKRRLADVAAKFPLLETKTAGVTRVPAVIDGWIPPKPGADAEQFPFLIVRPSGGTDTDEGADQNGRATVKIIIGTYSDTDDGFLDVVLLVDAIRSDLWERPTLDGTAYEHFGPLTWEIPEQQPRPEWFGTVTTIWNVSRPRRIEALYSEQEG